MHLSRAPGFTHDELDHLSIWETPGLFDDDGELNPQHQEEVVEQAPILTVEEIEAMQHQAYEEAFAQGKSEGFAQGYQEGLSQGTEEGYQQGLQQGLAEGSQKGYDEALAQGTHEMHEMQKQQVKQYSQLMDALNEPFKKLDARVEKQLVNLAIAIAGHLVRRELKADPGEVVAVVRAAVNVLPLAAQNINLHLHPADAELVKSSLALTHTITSWNIIENPLISQGGCQVMTDVSFVDATVEKRLAAVIAMVLGGEREMDDDFAAEPDMEVPLAETEELTALEQDAEFMAVAEEAALLQTADASSLEG